MKSVLRASGLLWALAAGGVLAQTVPQQLPGASLPGLLALARSNNPEYASMRMEAQAASERVGPAGALPDPKLRIEWMDITQGGKQNPTLLPANVGSTKYTLMQDLPWFGKRDLKTGVARAEADSAQGKAQASWTDLVARVKTVQAQRRYLQGQQALTQELLDLMVRLEQVALARYAGGLARQSDAIRAQMAQTAMRTELVALQSERAQADARLNVLLARGASEPLAAPDDPRALPAVAQLDTSTLAERVRHNNPQLQSEFARVTASEQAQALTLRNRYPDVTLSLSPTQMQNTVTEWGLMLELNLPLQQGSRRAQEREAQAMRDAAQARTEALANQLLADLSQNLSALDAARRTEKLASGSLLPQAELTYQSALASFENGKLDIATLLDAQSAVRQAKQNQIKAQLEAHMRLAEIEKILGEDL